MQKFARHLYERMGKGEMLAVYEGLAVVARVLCKEATEE
jgi:hypothetical protein